MQKYHDEILYGAKLDKQEFPAGYHNKMKAFLRTVKKEKAGAKSDGNLEEQDAGEIPWALFHALCGWALTGGNIMLWCFMIIQWNVMGRSVNVDPIDFCNLS